jgi:alcohol dehydrogenase (cytochrome c)
MLQRLFLLPIITLGVLAPVARSQSPPVLAAAATSPAALTFTAQQAERGKLAYEQQCQRCHGAHLYDGTFGIALQGPVFMVYFGGKSVEEFYTRMSTTMPTGSPGSLSPETYADLTAFILQANGGRAGAVALPSDPKLRAAMLLPNGEFLGFSPYVSKLPQVAVPNPLDHWTPVSDELLRDPPAQDWLSWRRTYDVHGFSPLNQISKTNVSQLQLAWNWSLPAGVNIAAPLVHDGVMFVMGRGDSVEALDARSGEPLWVHRRQLPKGAMSTVKRGLAVYGDRVYIGTSDVHVVALDAKTGKLVWDREIGDFNAREGITGGPLIAAGKLLIGTVGTGPGTKRPQIVGLDTDSGRIAWRVNAIAEPGTPGGDSWNGVPLELRSGGSIWSPGSYDPASGLAFFGTGNTYDTGPLLHPIKKAGVTSDALYTDSTLAIDATSGKLAWHFQHFPNDQWDQDWAFEQQIVQVPFKGQSRAAILAAGKSAIYDVVDASTGEFLYAMDMGLQNIIKSVDPKTGHKNIDTNLLPGDGKIKVVCPDVAGAKSFMPGSFDAATHTAFMTLVEACMDMYPAPGGFGGSLTSGVQLGVRPRPDGDGNYGRIQALNIATRQVQWTVRQRAPFTSGVLATAGGLVFAGSLDRYFHAYDASSGKQLWQTRLNIASSSNPISYAVDGEQYIAIVAGGGEFQATSYERLLPELRAVQSRGAAVWVFKLGH